MAKHTRPMNDRSNTEQQFPAECRWLHRLINQRSFKITVCVIVCILNVVDLLVDWYFFMSKATIQQVN
jgi:hypothetical protein